MSNREELDNEKTEQSATMSDEEYVREHKRNRAIEERVKHKIAELLESSDA